MKPPLHIKKHSSSAFWCGGAAPYQKALDKCGYLFTLHYEPPTTNKRKDRQQNNILRYNPPISKNVSTNIGHRLLALVVSTSRKTTLQHNQSAKAAWITLKRPSPTNNKRILNLSEHIDDTAKNTHTKDTKTCSCRQKNTCPLNGNCLSPSLIYQATVTCKDNSTTETYMGRTENDFKTRFRNHTASFRHTKHGNPTKLNKHIWTLKENNIDHFILWHILSSRSP